MTKSQIARRSKWIRDEIRRLCAFPMPLAAILSRHGGRVDRLYGKCRMLYSNVCSGGPNEYFARNRRDGITWRCHSKLFAASCSNLAAGGFGFVRTDERMESCMRQ